MRNNSFVNISLRGRMAFAIMCCERYLLYKYPEKNWEVLFKHLWEITSIELFDEWLSQINEILPECLLEFSDYESSDFSILTKSEYEEFKNLYQGIKQDVNTIIKMIWNLINDIAYSEISDASNNKSNQKDMIKIIQILEKENIEIPDIKAVEFSSFTECDGNGNQFDGTNLSSILNKDIKTS